MELTDSDLATIRRNAYFRWLDAGAPPGDGVGFWLEAESDYVHNPPAGEEEEAPGSDSAKCVSDARPSARRTAKTDKELLIGTRG